MELDEFTIVLTILRPDAPDLDDEAAEALQNAHMAHLADLHEAGYLLAAGPLDDPELRGLSIYSVGPDRARELRAQDPAVIAGRLSIKVIPWHVPRGAVHFTPTRFPRSTAEVEAGD
jgi:uncharacterized protein YciI